MKNKEIVKFLKLMLNSIDRRKEMGSNVGLCVLSGHIYCSFNNWTISDYKIDGLIHSKAKEMGLYDTSYGNYIFGSLPEFQSVEEWYAPRIKVLNEIITNYE